MVKEIKHELSKMDDLQIRLNKMAATLDRIERELEEKK